MKVISVTTTNSTGISSQWLRATVRMFWALVSTPPLTTGGLSPGPMELSAVSPRMMLGHRRGEVHGSVSGAGSEC